MAQLVGAIIAVALLSRLVLRFVTRARPEFQRRAIADVATGVGATVIGAWGLANGGPPLWLEAAASYLPAALVMLAYDRVRTAPNPEEGAPTDTVAPATVPPVAVPLPVAQTPRTGGLRQWQIGLHPGQLALLLLFSIPMSIGAGFVALFVGIESHNAAGKLAAGDYAGGAAYVQLGGMDFSPVGDMSRDSIAEWQRRVDAAQAEGWGGDSLVSAIEASGFRFHPFLKDLPTMSGTAAHRYWSWPLLLACVALLGFSLQTLWVWLGARARPLGGVNARSL